MRSAYRPLVRLHVSVRRMLECSAQRSVRGAGPSLGANLHARGNPPAGSRRLLPLRRASAPAGPRMLRLWRPGIGRLAPAAHRMRRPEAPAGTAVDYNDPCPAVQESTPTTNPTAISRAIEYHTRGDRGRRGLSPLASARPRNGQGRSTMAARRSRPCRRPSPLIAQNKVAAQLCNESGTYFPQNASRTCLLLRILPSRGLRPSKDPLHREG